MNQLTKFLVDGILNEGEQKTLAAYGGGFKPPTAGHFEVVKKALRDNPEIDEFIIYVGSGTRNGITQAESILIWEIYQTYLPMKVKIEPSKAPIGDVLRLGKNNPQDKVYFVIGAREGNEGDLEDIKNRTRAIGGKHPNMEVKVITTKNEGMSGTNARKAAKVSFEDFAKFLPTELSNDEKETVYNIVKPVVKESLNENASYSQDIDIKQRIMQLTQHMLDKGMNIEPLPSVELLDGDSVNAREFLGKTAYYDPNSATIVLYTEGRHPKDIVRSFSHEMIHHIQNLEGRLDGITTTNTQEDDHLNDIEAEANLKGTMTFRNWTDSLNENILPQEKFAQEKNQDYVEQALKILPNKDKYNLKDYTVEILPIDKIKPTQFGEDYINASSEYEAEQYQKYIDGEIEAEDLRREDFYPIVVDKDTMEILDGNHRHAVHTMLSIPKIKAILVSKKLNEANKPITKEILFEEEDKLMVDVVNPDGERFEYEESNIKGLYTYKDSLDNLYFARITYSPSSPPRFEFKVGWFEDNDISKPKYDPQLPPNTTSMDDLKRRNTVAKIYRDEILPYLKDNQKLAKQLDINPISQSRYIFSQRLVQHHTPPEYNIDLRDRKIVISKKLNEANKPYKHKYGFDDKLGKDPFGISAYARELALGLEEEIEEGRKKKKDPKKGTGKKPKDSSRRLYTDEDPKDTIGIKFRTKEDIVDTLNKKSFEAKSHARQSQIINLIHQRVRAAYNNAKDPDTKSRLKRGLDYITKRKESSKKKTQRLKNQKNENVAPDHDGKAAPYGSGYKPVNENKTTHKVIAKGIVFEPKDIIINVGDTVEWENKEGYHNVNGKTSHPRNKNNPESFGNKVGSGWTYKFTFTKPGLYKYHCDPHLSADMVGTIQVKENVKEGDTYEKMAAKGKKAGSLKQGTVRKRLGIKKGDKIPLSLINKEIARLRKMDKDPDKKGAQLGDKNQKYYKALQLSKTLKTTTNVNEDAGMIKCSNCGWEWELSNGGDDPYLCHKCGHDNKPNLMEGRYDTITNKLSKIIFEAFKDIHDRGEDKGKISLTIGPDDEDIISNEFEFDLEATVEFVNDDQYEVDGGANVGFDDEGEEVTPLLSVRFKIPKNPKWNTISFDIKDVVRHELEHLTQEGENLKSGKFMKDDQILRNLIDMELLSKAEYFKLEKEVDAMLQGMYFKAKKSKTPFEKVLNDYLDIFVDQKSISKEEKDDVLNIWRSRRKALSLPPFE